MRIFPYSDDESNFPAANNDKAEKNNTNVRINLFILGLLC